MGNCLYCGTSMTASEGRRPKKFCSDLCRQKHWHESKKKPEKYPDSKEIQVQRNCCQKNNK